MVERLALPFRWPAPANRRRAIDRTAGAIFPRPCGELMPPGMRANFGALNASATPSRQPRAVFAIDDDAPISLFSH
jgi:hypothetical protein